jgi:23S rRNA pseudouridine2605 synthase
MRLNKYLASAGISSRRGADAIINNGRVKVNGKPVREMGVDVSEKDYITVDDIPVIGGEKKVYIALNKPKGYITTTKDQFNRPSVLALTHEITYRIFPVGRLDYATSGLLLLTNDGDFANTVTHPSKKIYKTYIARILGFPGEGDIIKLRCGVALDDGVTSPASADIIKKYTNGVDVKLSISEGRNRQVRRMFEALGFKAVALKRISVGSILLGNLPVGKWRHLTPREIMSIKK